MNVSCPFAQKLEEQSLEHLDYITSRHGLYERYRDLWKLCQDSWYGGAEYKHGHYLRAYQVDMNQPGEQINTYTRHQDGSIVAKYRAKLEPGYSKDATEKGQDPLFDGSFYGEKLDNTPLYNYVKLIVAEYNAILFRNPPQRELPDNPEIAQFIYNVDGEGNDITEFMALVDMYSTVYGVCHVGCYMSSGSDTPKFKIHSPLDVTNWSYRYDNQGNLKLDSVVIELEASDCHSVFRHMTQELVETYFVGDPDDEDYEPPAVDNLEYLSDNTYVLRQENELGYIPLTTIYQSTKIYNNIGTSVIHDVAQIQRSIYGDLSEIYSSIIYGAHPTLIVDETTESMNDGQIGAEPGSVVRVQNSLTGEANYVYEFVSPQLDAITEIRELIDNKINKLTQLAMLRSEDLVKSSRSGEQIEVYDDKLASLIRRKATNLENAEYRLWQVWGDWLNQDMSGVRISYNRQYNKRAIEHEISELEKLMTLYDNYSSRFDSADIEEDLRDKLRQRMLELLNATSTNNGL